MTAKNIRAWQIHDVKSKWKSKVKTEKGCKAMRTHHEHKLKGKRKEFLPS